MLGEAWHLTCETKSMLDYCTRMFLVASAKGREKEKKKKAFGL
jgi:hypothetical protein